MPKDRHGRKISEMLTSRAFPDLNEAHRKHYDQIIVDTPPVLG